MQKTIEINEYIYVLLHFCLCITSVMFVLLYFENFINNQSLYFQGFITILFGIGGIAIYIMLGSKLAQIRKKQKR